MTASEKIMNRLLEMCWRNTGEKIHIKYYPYILSMMREHGNKQFIFGFLLGVLGSVVATLLYILIKL